MVQATVRDKGYSAHFSINLSIILQSTLISNLESVENRSRRFILSNYNRTTSVTSIKSGLSSPPLLLCRKCSGLCLFYKIYHSNPNLRQKLLLNPSFICLQIDHKFEVGIPPVPYLSIPSRTDHQQSGTTYRQF